MATIVFYISPLQHEFNSILKLTNTLKLLGHKVFYLGFADSEEKVCKYGFSFVTILEKWFPKGFFQQLDNNYLNLSGLELLLEQRKYVKLLKSLMYSLYQGENREIHNVLKEIHPDLLLIGTSMTSYASVIALIAYECQIGTIYFTDMFPELPPAKNIIKQEKNINNAAQYRHYLLFNFLNQSKIKLCFDYLKRKFNFLIGRGFEEDPIRRFAIDRKIPVELLDWSLSLPLKLPHLFLCPEELDFPNSSREGCYYAEASIDLQREEPSFDWSKLNKNKALIYCSLGTTGETFQTVGKKKAQKFFQNVIDAVSLKKEYQLIVSVSEHINIEDLRYIPEDTIIVNRAPQLALLEKASLAIINGGIRTLKECIYWGVPMIVFPISADQPENAEIVKYHGLGVVGDIKNTSVSLIIDLVDKIENNCFFKPRLETLKQKFREIENSGKATKIILDFLENNKRI
ncbi:UDP-glucuronosyltransferase-like glycosyl transferase [Brasilonema sp. CT11]|nr:UDP-glucuronosyltransferase-like glycosyl transferase [Brasilonema sp. CT11]